MTPNLNVHGLSMARLKVFRHPGKNLHVCLGLFKNDSSQKCFILPLTTLCRQKSLFQVYAYYLYCQSMSLLLFN